MKEIKFRAWRASEKHWVYGVSANRDAELPSNTFHLSKFFELVEEGVLTHVCQFIWMKDKDGNEIYEKDIARTSQYGKIKIEQVSIMIAIDKYSCYVDVFPFGTDAQREDGWGCPQDSTIIGNVVETPELLKEHE